MKAPMDRLNSALEGRYRIEREIGEGGMATVYLAEDLRHRRRVALKVLKPELAAVVGADRFLTEIETTANLQHPHILPLFDSGDVDGIVFFVMPFVEGESLRGRLDREKQLRVEDAVALTKKVADAVDYAHEKGVVHRDIKPANILLSPRGEPLVADFGIALAVSQAGGGRITETGLSLGTPHYMSPEQATGDRDVDPRSDVYALGCVLYEMLAGQPPFAAPTAQAVLTRILTEDARRVTELRRTVPPHVAAAVARALEKLPADRFDSAAEFREALEDEGYRYEPVRTPAARAVPGVAVEGGRRSTRSWLTDPRTVAALAAVALLGVAALVAGTREAGAPDALDAARALPAWRFDVTEEFRPEGGLDLAEDGTLVFSTIARDASVGTGLMIRRPGEAGARPLPGTQAGFHPTFSPDGEWIAFSTADEVLKIPVGGGPAVTLARDETGRSPLVMLHWGPADAIALARPDGLYRVSANGGTPEKVYSSKVPFGALSPYVLPGGRRWLFTEGEGLTPATPNLMLLDTETGEARLLAESAGAGLWLPTGHVAYVHLSGALFAAPFDLDSGAFTGPAVPVVDSVKVAMISRPFVTAGGSAALFLGAPLVGGPGRIALLDVTGGGSAVEPPLDPATHPDGHVSPDGRRIAYTTDDQVRVFDLELGTNLRLTTEGANHHDPVWSPDGSMIAFGSERDSTGVDIWVKDADGSGPARPLLRMDGVQYPKEWTADGLLLVQTDHAGNNDLYLMPADGSGEPRPYVRADWDEQLPRISPDGRWLVYHSLDTDPSGVVVRSFPVPGRAYRISDPAATLDAINPLWSPDGRTIYYQEGPALMAADVRTEPEFAVVERRELTRFLGTIRDVHPDGRILAFRAGVSDDEDARLVVVANWLSELAERLGDGGGGR